MHRVTVGVAADVNATRFWLSAFGLVLLTGCARDGGTRADSRAPTLASAPAPNSTEDTATLARFAADAYAKQDWATSERYYAALSTRVPTDVEAWFKLGNIYARTARFELAVRAYHEVVRRDTRHARAWHNMGVIQLRQAAGSFEELRKYAAADDPLAKRGDELRRAIRDLLAPDASEVPRAIGDEATAPGRPAEGR